MSNHRNVSLAKSAIRSISVILIMLDLTFFGLLGFLVAEAIGVVEEFV